MKKSSTLLLVAGAVVLYLWLTSKKGLPATPAPASPAPAAIPPVNTLPQPPGVPAGSTPAGNQTNGVWDYWVAPDGTQYVPDPNSTTGQWVPSRGAGCSDCSA